MKLSIHKTNNLEKKYQLHYKRVVDDSEDEAQVSLIIADDCMKNSMRVRVKQKLEIL